MSSNLTTFFPAAGGGGVSSDPNTLLKTVSNNQSRGLFMKRGATTSYHAGTSNFWSDYGGSTNADSLGSYVLLPTTTASFETIVDFTNTGKGGKLCNIISPLVRSGTTAFTFKITIDGTQTLISVPSPIEEGRYLLGGFIQGGTATPNTISTQFAYQGLAYTNYYSSNNKTADGFFTPSVGSANYYTVPISLTTMSHIDFKDSCKVEFGWTGTLQLYDGTVDRNAGAMIIQN
jgi:hypothetical protein